MAFSRRDFMQGLMSLPALLGFGKASTWFDDPSEMSPDELRTTNLSGAFEADYGVLRPELRGTGEALLAHRPSFTYQQSIQVWQPGGDKEKRYYVAGRVQGLAKFNRLIGPASEVYKFIAKHKELENKGTLRISTHTDGELVRKEDKLSLDGPERQFQMTHSVMSFCGPLIVVGGMAIVEDVQVMFTELIMPNGKRYDFALAGMERGAS